MNVSFADLLTPAGVTIAAGFVTGIVSVVKAALPVIDARISGATLAAILSALLYVAVALVTATDPNGYLVAAFAWVTCALGAIGINSAAGHLADVRAGTAGKS